jgi:hypothetical protein
MAATLYIPPPALVRAARARIITRPPINWAEEAVCWGVIGEFACRAADFLDDELPADFDEIRDATYFEATFLPGHPELNELSDRLLDELTAEGVDLWPEGREEDGDDA